MGEKGRDDCADALTSNLPTKEEITQNRFYLERDYKVQPTKERMQRNPRLDGFKLPDRMPTLPRELEIPEQFTLPYARCQNAAAHGVQPFLDIQWSVEEGSRNLSRRERLATSK